MPKKIPLCIIAGPTAVGKTDISISVAENLNGEIISADSMQIYKYMDIGTAKVKFEEMKNIPHYMIDIVYPDEEFSVADYKKRAKYYINKIDQNNKLPIVTGGTGFYINSLIYNLSFTEVPSNQELRNKYDLLCKNYGMEYIYEELKKVDVSSAKRINPNDKKRIIRALEIYYTTGKPMSYYYKDFRKRNNSYNAVIIGITMDREKLYKRINKRVEKMIEEGLIEEVNTLLKMGYGPELVSMQGIGYKEIIPYLKGKTTLENAISSIKTNSRRYAKRQLTWFRREKNIEWVNLDNYKSIEEVSDHIIKYVINKLNLNKNKEG
ncbi:MULTISPECIES: tRNA (adenosine(37)-N6)-dimethylallyltransferase MiaA [Tissierellales]|jgi:tRNA dimethylallyltransferase|uniref:tRNA dimethylallyltransferase n=1 Tax=Acidilutibacter cellobiosedens TaxID=2507161 RepID=A0A410QCF1_9FIRM|nr:MULTISPECIES: tRNA (adenosine(37)-N6)-dimethylallyltransferase MiaA [Tissierellales]QAT61703.1 tRNA (adenosine(37)-N6)-dimethylallyltransferase MiaA [Acidilutibacter cellobiosedens]SCL82667.1 tRNA dimethylallyltransferase [Sporanaerobacter sp. PP17-6a]